jgi:PadR family transcriptional regulator, regulatory protein PadR
VLAPAPAGVAEPTRRASRIKRQSVEIRDRPLLDSSEARRRDSAPGAVSYRPKGQEGFFIVDEIVEELRFPRALVAPVLLVLLAESPGHGYELVERLKAFGFRGARARSCYRELRRLENQDLVTSFWEGPDRGPARRIYQLTAKGSRTLRGCAVGAADLASLLVAFLDRCQALTQPRPLRQRRIGDSPRRRTS